MAGLLGILTAHFVLAGLLPAAFIFYGRSNDKGWATVTGWVLFALLGVMSVLGNGLESLSAGHIAGYLLVGYAATKSYPRKYAPEPSAPE